MLLRVQGELQVMPIPFFVDHNGVPLQTYEPIRLSSEVEEKEPTLAEVAARQAAKQSTHKAHSFTLNHTYSGAGCAICGKDRSAHPSDV